VLRPRRLRVQRGAKGSTPNDQRDGLSGEASVGGASAVRGAAEGVVPVDANVNVWCQL